MTNELPSVGLPSADVAAVPKTDVALKQAVWSRWLVLAACVWAIAFDAHAQGSTVPAAPRAPLPSGVTPAPSGSVLSDRILQRYRNGDYEWVVDIGPGAIRDDPTNVALQLAVANSYAWTGRYQAAIDRYRALSGTSASIQGEIGIAYIEMWRQRPWIALPMLEGAAARAADPRDAKEALGRVRDQLRPRTTFRLGTSRDSEEVRRNGAGISHAWWDSTADTRLEVSAQADRERVSPLSLDYREVGFSIFRPRTVLAPRLDVAAEIDPCRSGYGTLQIEPVSEWLQLKMGRTNWGRQVFNPRALRDCLFAARFGVAGAPEFSAGRIVYSADINRISDDNRVTEAMLRIEPEVLRFGHGFRADFGVAARHARRADPRYWSPADGHGVAFVGLTYSRWTDTIGGYIRLQPGTALWGEAKGFSWGASGGGKWIVSRNWAIGLDAWFGSNPRPGQYRASIVTLALEYAW